MLEKLVNILPTFFVYKLKSIKFTYRIKIKTNRQMKFLDLTPKAQEKAKSNFWAAKEVLTDYVFHKSVVKVTAIFIRHGEEIIHEMTFSKSGSLLSDVIESRRFL